MQIWIQKWTSRSWTQAEGESVLFQNHGRCSGRFWASWKDLRMGRKIRTTGAETSDSTVLSYLSSPSIPLMISRDGSNPTSHIAEDNLHILGVHTISYCSIHEGIFRACSCGHITSACQRRWCCYCGSMLRSWRSVPTTDTCSRTHQ